MTDNKCMMMVMDDDGDGDDAHRVICKCVVIYIFLWGIKICLIHTFYEEKRHMYVYRYVYLLALGM